MMIRYIRGYKDSTYIDGVIGGAFFCTLVFIMVSTALLAIDTLCLSSVLNLKLNFEIKFTLPASL